MTTNADKKFRIQSRLHLAETETDLRMDATSSQRNSSVEVNSIAALHAMCSGVGVLELHVYFPMINWCL